MVKIEIKDSVWNVFKKSWALEEVTDHNELVRSLETEMLGISLEVIKEAKRNPDAYPVKLISLKDDRREKNENDV
jgi:hypothetical protein